MKNFKIFMLVFFSSSLLFTIKSSLFSQPPGSGWTKVFQEDFSSSLNGDIWWTADDCTRLNSNNQNENFFQETNVSTDTGKLILTVNNDNPICGSEDTPYSHAMTTTATEYLYGYFEFKAKFETGKRLIPAIWLRSRSNSDYHEVDIIETCALNNGDEGYFTVQDEEDGDCIPERDYVPFDDIGPYDIDTDTYNTYGFLWTPTEMKLYINGSQEGSTITNHNYHSSMYILLSASTVNLGDSGWCSGIPSSSNFPMNFIIDWVKVYQKLNESFYIIPETICEDENFSIYYPFYYPFSSSITPDHSANISHISTTSYAVSNSLDHPDCPNKTIGGIVGEIKVNASALGQEEIKLDINFDTGESISLLRDIVVEDDYSLGGEYTVSGNTYTFPSYNPLNISSSSCSIELIENHEDDFNEITWTKDSGSASYNVLGNGETVNITNLGTIYLTASVKNSCGTFTKTFGIVKNTGGGYRISPNPALFELNIEAKENKIIVIDENGDQKEIYLDMGINTVEILNLNGNILKSKSYYDKKNKIKININNLPTGNYYLVIRNATDIYKYQISKL